MSPFDQDYLNKKSNELDVMETDPARRGVHIILQADEKAANTLVSLSLTKAPLAEVIRYVTTSAGLKEKISPDTITLVNDSGKLP